MGNVNIRNIDDAVKLKIKTIAAAKGRSMEAELRDIIIRAAAAPPSPRNIYHSIRDRVLRNGDVELDIPPRVAPRQNVTFKK